MKIRFLNYWPVSFIDINYEREFRNQILSEDKRVTFLFQLVVLFLSMLFIRNDFLLFDNSFQFFILLALRCIYCIGTFFSFYLQFKSRSYRFFDNQILIWLVCSILLVFYINSTRPSGFFVNSLIDIFMVFAVYVLMPINTIIKVIIAIVYTSLNSILLLFLRSEVSTSQVNTIIITYIGVNALGIAISHRAEIYKRLRFKLLSDEKKHKDEIQKYVEELESNNAELDSYNHTVAHDLKTPVSGIIGYLEILEDGLLENAFNIDSVKKYVHLSIHVANSLGRIINELLLLSSVNRNKNVEAISIEMGRVVDNALDRFKFDIEKHGVDIKLPDKWLGSMGHEPWIEEVWANYISNAIKYGGNPPKIELGNKVLENGMVQYWVKDNGNGVAEEDRNLLFMEFSKNASLKVNSSGLGLSIVKRIITKLNGEYGYQKTLDEGAVFYFTLPQ